MEIRLILSRQGNISLQEWLSYVSQSSIIKLTKPRQGVNPFTKLPHLYHPAPGSASFETEIGHVSISYQSGTLEFVLPSVEQLDHDSANPGGRRIIEEIAQALNATISRK
jgi:hypothetical protein